MDRIRLDIVTDDRAYGRTLADALTSRSRNFVVRVRGCDEYIALWKSRGYSIRNESDMILWDEKEAESICSGNIIWIRENEEELPKEEGRYSIYRYDTVTAICGRLMDIYTLLTGRVVTGMTPAETRVIAFVSWQGGSGCTTVCHAVAQELTRFYGKKILVISLDSFGPAAAKVDTSEYAGGADAFLYRFFHRREGFDIDMFTVRDGYGVSFVAPSSGRNPLTELSRDEGKNLMEGILDRGGYDGVLIDAGDRFSDGATAMIAFADRLCCVEKDPQEDREARCMSYIDNAFEAGVRPIEIIKVINQSIPDESSATEGGRAREKNKSKAPDRYMKTVELASRLSGRDEILLEGEFGSNVHVLTELLWYNKN